MLAAITSKSLGHLSSPVSTALPILATRLQSLSNGTSGLQVRSFNEGPPRPRGPPPPLPPMRPSRHPLSTRRRVLPRNLIIRFVPEQESWIVERMGRFNRILQPGLNILIPVIERIAYTQSLKEVAIEIPSQSAITEDNVTLELDGVLYYRVVDSFKASYGVEDAEFAVTQLAMTTMRSEIGQLTLDRTLAERTQLNKNIVEAINAASQSWGIQCLRYEIRDIHPPERIVKAMHTLVSAERSKRASILESEGQRQADINVAEGQKQSQILASEADKMQNINRATGEAEAITLKAVAEAQAISKVATAIVEGANKTGKGGLDAVQLSVAEKWVGAWSNLAQNAGSVVVVPNSVGDAAGMITQV